jgi:hypothetical protein
MMIWQLESQFPENPRQPGPQRLSHPANCCFLYQHEQVKSDIKQIKDAVITLV